MNKLLLSNTPAMLKRVFIVATVFSLMAFVSNVATAQGTTEQVFAHHLKAFLDRNIEENMKDYTEDSIVIIPNAIFKGKKQIRGLFMGLFTEFAKPGMTFKLNEQRVVDNIVYISWTAETADNVYEHASDTFVIVDGKIAVQTIALKVKAKAKAK